MPISPSAASVLVQVGLTDTAEDGESDDEPEAAEIERISTDGKRNEDWG